MIISLFARDGLHSQDYRGAQQEGRNTLLVDKQRRGGGLTSKYTHAPVFSLKENASLSSRAAFSASITYWLSLGGCRYALLSCAKFEIRRTRNVRLGYDMWAMKDTKCDFWRIWDWDFKNNKCEVACCNGTNVSSLNFPASGPCLVREQAPVLKLLFLVTRNQTRNQNVLSLTQRLKTSHFLPSGLIFWSWNSVFSRDDIHAQSCKTVLCFSFSTAALGGSGCV